MITGATSGFGKAAALKFAENGYSVIITGRRKELLEKLSSEIKKKFKMDVLPLHFDVQDFNKVKTAINTLRGKWKNIDVLVNNAGLAAGFGSIDEGVVDDWEQMIDTNIKGLLYVSKLIFPVMIKRKQGHIINIGSVAGKEVYAKGNVYCATKFAVDALTKAMRIDLLPFNIKVTGICPGAAETEFSLVRFKGDAQKAKNIYTGFTPLTAGDVAEVIWFAASRPAHVNINDIVIMPTAQADTKNLFTDFTQKTKLSRKGAVRAKKNRVQKNH